nr:protein YLS9-like [Ipomoea batatas]
MSGGSVTAASALSSRGHKEVTVWSPFVNGNAVPVAVYLGAEISQDQNAGRVLVNVRVDGRVTLASRNPNERIGIYYDRLDVYATYRGQQITLPTLLPVSYQGHKDVTIWSPFLNGNAVPVAPYLGVEISQDQNAGRVLINIRVDGRIRWKVGTFISGRYRLDANCPAYLSFGENYSPNSILVGSTAKYQLVQNCHVDV